MVQEQRSLSIKIEDEIKQSYLDYAMSVIIGRALPDVRDGLKHRGAVRSAEEVERIALAAERARDQALSVTLFDRHASHLTSSSACEAKGSQEF